MLENVENSQKKRRRFKGKSKQSKAKAKQAKDQLISYLAMKSLIQFLPLVTGNVTLV
jgi:hypothetical protein